MRSLESTQGRTEGFKSISILPVVDYWPSKENILGSCVEPVIRLTKKK